MSVFEMIHEGNAPEDDLLNLEDENEYDDIDVDEYVMRSIRRRTSVTEAAHKVEAFTINSKLLPTLTETFQPIISSTTDLPDFKSMTAGSAVETMGELLGVTDHETNFISFWTLDVIAGCLQEVQKKGMDMNNQKALIAWFGFFLKTLTVYNWDREQTFSDFKKLILIAQDIIKTQNTIIPNPIQCLAVLNNESLSKSSTTLLLQSRSSTSSISKPKKPSKTSLSPQVKKNSIRQSGGDQQKNISDLQLLAECLYNIFANRFKYETIKSAFLYPTDVTTILLPHQLQIPKSLDEAEKKLAKDKKETKETKSKTPKTKEQLQVPLEPPQEMITSDKYIIPLSKATNIDEKFFAELFPEPPKEPIVKKGGKKEKSKK